MSFTEKIDVLELLIEILVEHEKRLDELIACLELLIDQIDGSLLIDQIDGLIPEVLDEQQEPLT